MCESFMPGILVGGIFDCRGRIILGFSMACFYEIPVKRATVNYSCKGPKPAYPYRLGDVGPKTLFVGCGCVN